MAVDATAGGAIPARASALPLTLLGDERLARMVAGGNERAFAALYGRYRQRLYGYCYSILRHAADAQDALQSTFAAAYAALRDGRRDAPLRPWLYRIAHNEAVSVLRRRPAHSELSEEIPASGVRVEDRAAERERLARLVADLRQLPERQRSALIMREFSGMSHNSIAVALRTSAEAAKQAIFEARRSLAELERGRSMCCDEVCRIVSHRDGRALRSRRVRSHLRDCTECAAFAAAIPRRSADLRALAPALPPTVAAGILARATGGAGSGVGGPGSGAVGIEGTTAAGLTNLKVTAAVLVAAATGVAGVVEVNQLRPGPRTDSQQHRITLASDARSQRASHSRSTVADGSIGHHGVARRAHGRKTVAGPVEPRAAQAARGSASIAPAAAPGSVAGAPSGSAVPGTGADENDSSPSVSDGAPSLSEAVRGSTQRTQTPGAARVLGAATRPPGSPRGCADRGSACSGASPVQPLDAASSHRDGAARPTSNGTNPPDGGPVSGAGSLAGGAGPQVAPPSAPGSTGRAQPALAEPRTPRHAADRPA